MIGSEVALLFEDGDPRPLIVGRIVDPARKADRRRWSATGAVCGSPARNASNCDAARPSIIMEKDGRITIRGTYVTSHASAANRIRGGSVNLN